MKFNHFCSSSERGRVFVGMSFTSLTSPLVFDAITRACGAIGLQAIRVDQSAGSPPIPQEIERLLRSVDFAIFDLTDVKPNVLNEIGFAGGTGVPESRVLLVAPKGTAIPFNISHRLIRFYRGPKHLTEIVQSCLAEMLAKRQSEAESLPAPIKFPGGEVSGPKVVSHGDHNVVVAGDHNKIEIKSPRRSSQRLPLIPGTLGEHPLMKGYLDYLVDRYNEFKEWEAGHASKKPAWARIRVDYKREIGFNVVNTPIQRFDDAVEYLQRRIANTKMGRINSGKGQPLFSTFDEFASGTRSQRRSRRRTQPSSKD